MHKMEQLINYLLNKQLILRIVMYFLSNSKKEQIYIARFRSELAFWGHDVSDMKDEEIKDGINKIGKMIAKCGMTIDEATEALKALANYT
jgi:hypothetical protein